MKKIIVIGSSNVDMVMKTSHLPAPGETILGGEFLMNQGGKGANQAVAVRRMGGNLIFMAKLGNDILGRQSLEYFENEGIDTRYLTLTENAASGVALISVDSQAENSIIVASGANMLLNEQDVDRITEEMEEERIDKCMSLLVENLSRSFIQKLIKDGHVLVNGKPVKGSYRVKCEDEVVFSVPESVEPDIEPENIPLDILYEDADLIVVNKPKGMVVHPAAGHYTGTLVNALMYHCGNELSGINGVLRPGIVHRIDRDTTGSVIACKNDKAHRCIAEQLKEHSINRRYRAICFGELEQEEGTIDQPIGRHPNDRKKMAVNPQNGKRAVTHYRVLQRFQGYTYIECVLETGRTHQIRVHMASIGHPLLGDEVYSNRKSPFKLQGQTLHAKTLGFIHPTTGEYLEIDAPLPEYFEHLLTVLA